MRSLALCSLLLVSCGADDPRSPTVEVISTEILAPACGAPQCHSTSTLQSGYAFDTLAASKVALKSLKSGTGIKRSLMEELTTKRMPPDVPLDDADLTLIRSHRRKNTAMAERSTPKRGSASTPRSALRRNTPRATTRIVRMQESPANYICQVLPFSCSRRLR